MFEPTHCPICNKKLYKSNLSPHFKKIMCPDYGEDHIWLEMSVSKGNIYYMNVAICIDNTVYSYIAGQNIDVFIYIDNKILAAIKQEYKFTKNYYEDATNLVKRYLKLKAFL